MVSHDARPHSAFGRTVPAVAENVASLRHAIVELADAAGAPPPVRTDLALAVGEACANVVVHAYPPGDTGPLIVQAAVVDGREIIVSVVDQGQGMTPRPDSPGLGLGLPLIANLSDRLEIQDGPDGVGTQVEMAFLLRRTADCPQH
ncbi:MAG TPA: ATP-binding protein [Solirubrobacteraceae bacterium]|nr:ATP-binding protein [Solirubrobacteraceae bacterium]